MNTLKGITKKKSLGNEPKKKEHKKMNTKNEYKKINKMNTVKLRNNHWEMNPTKMNTRKLTERNK